MWIILLDRSPSMMEPFSGAPAPPGRVRVAAAETKWEAAKSAILTEFRSFPAQEQVCVIAFDASAAVVFEGTPADEARLRVVLDELGPGDGTDVSAALRTAHDYVVRKGELFVNVEVISDGLS